MSEQDRTDWVAGNIAERITRSLQRLREHRLHGDIAEAEAAEVSLNGWIGQWARVKAESDAQ